jgi:hypothetical protein
MVKNPRDAAEQQLPKSLLSQHGRRRRDYSQSSSCIISVVRYWRILYLSWFTCSHLSAWVRRDSAHQGFLNSFGHDPWLRPLSRGNCSSVGLPILPQSKGDNIPQQLVCTSAVSQIKSKHKDFGRSISRLVTPP